MPNSFYVEPASPMAALMAGVHGYKQGQEYQKQNALDEAGTALGNNDWDSAAKAALRSGNLDLGLNLLKLKQSREDSQQFGQDITRLLGSPQGAPQPQASPQGPLQTLMQPPQTAQPQAGQPGANWQPQPQRPGAPIQPTAKVWGDKEGEAAGLYEPTKPVIPPSLEGNGTYRRENTGPTQVTQQGTVQPMQPAAQPAPRSYGGAAAQPNAPTGQPSINGMPLATALPVLVRAATNPNLPKESQELAKALVLKALDDNKLPEEQKNYLRAQLDPKFREYQLETRRASATAITNDMRGENEESKAFGKSAGERGGAMMAAARAAPKKLQNLTRMESLLAQVEQGKIQPARMNISAWAKSLGLDDAAAERLGLDPKGVGTSQAIGALSNELALGHIGPGGIPANNFSNTDRTFVTDIVPKLANDPAGNKIMIESARRLEQLNIEKAKEWQAFRRNAANKGRGFDDFESDWNEKTASRDIFGDLTKKAEAIIGPQGSGGVAPPRGMPPGAKQAQDGNWYVSDPQRPGKYLQVR
jgi:hypothetical protein